MTQSDISQATIPPPHPGRLAKSAVYHGFRSPGVPGTAPPVATARGPAGVEDAPRYHEEANRRFFSFFLMLLACCFVLLSVAQPAAAAPTQQDVFRSIQDNVGG